METGMSIADWMLKSVDIAVLAVCRWVYVYICTLMIRTYVSTPCTQSVGDIQRPGKLVL